MSDESGDPVSGGSTRSVHGGEERVKPGKSVTNAIAQTATYVFDDLDEFVAFKAGEAFSHEYGRYGNPTVKAAENKLADLEGQLSPSAEAGAHSEAASAE